MLDIARRHRWVDLVVSILRWLLLAAAILVIFIDREQNPGTLSLYLATVLAFGAVYNLLITLLVLFDFLTRPIPYVSLIIDTVLAIVLADASGGIASPLLFFSLLPIITAAARFSLLVSLAVAILIALSHLGLSYSQSSTDLSDLLRDNLGNVGMLLLISLLSGWINNRIRHQFIIEQEKEQKEIQRQFRARKQQSQLIFELASTLSATLSYQRVLEAMLDVSEIGLRELESQEISLVGIVLLFQGDKLRVAASRHLPPRDRQNELKGESGIIAKALSTAEPTIGTQPTQDPELGQFFALHQCQSIVVIPLRAGFEGFGVAVFGSPVPNVFTVDYIDLLVALCNQGVVALQNAQLYQSLIEEKERIVAVEEDARKKLSRDLHDGPTQAIAAIAMRANYARMMMDRSVDEIPEELRRIEELARRTTTDIRHMLFTLRPLILETQGLVAALEQYIAKRSETDPLPIHLEAREGVDRVLDKAQQGMIFYIIEEALSNARKHAHAKNIWVRLRLLTDAFIAEVQDDGVGFDVSVLEKGYDERGSLGMLNMRERAELAGGHWKIESQPNKGTRVQLMVPLRRRFG
ncbi:MAG: GAF domain-containing protein [Anaerolineae bacterium]|nr:GAF domain-containing protein [Anaerolineae bacterium]